MLIFLLKTNTPSLTTFSVKQFNLLGLLRVFIFKRLKGILSFFEGNIIVFYDVGLQALMYIKLHSQSYLKSKNVIIPGKK